MTEHFKSESTLAFPGEVHPSPSGGVLVSKLDDVINWASLHSWLSTQNCLQGSWNYRCIARVSKADSTKMVSNSAEA